MIRPAQPQDAESVSRVIIAALRETNADDYSEAVITRVEQSFSPAAVRDLLERRIAFVAIHEDHVVGVATLDGHVVRTVFIHPDCQGRGIGRALMAKIAQTAIARGASLLAVASSVTAEPFYAKLGFSAVRDAHHGEERTVVMERVLPGSRETAPENER